MKVHTRFIKIFGALLVLALLFAALPAGEVKAQTTVEYDYGKSMADALGASAISTDFYRGTGSWSSNGNLMEFYIDPVAQLGLTGVTVDDIDSVVYRTKDDTAGGVDWGFYIYTVDIPETTTWYGYRLIFEPLYSINYDGAPADTWNTWDSEGSSNQIAFYDSNYSAMGFYYGPTLADIKAGPIDWSAYDSSPSGQSTSIDYGAQEVKWFKFGTGSGWASTFSGLLDAIELTISGTTYIIDLEELVPEVYVDDDVLCDSNLPCYATITEGLAAVAAGGKVNVYPGTYPEGVVIDKPNLTIKSTAGAADTIIDTPTGTLTTGVDIGATNLGVITFDGFTVQNFTENGIVQGMSDHEGTTFHVKNNIVIPENDYLRNGIQVSGDGSTVTGNTIYGAPLTDDWASSGIISVNASNVLIDGNTIIGGTLGIDSGITVQNYSGVVDNITVSNNTVTDANVALAVYGKTGYRDITDVTIDANSFTESNRAINIQTADIDGIKITDNTISTDTTVTPTSVSVGLRFSGSSATATGITITGNTFEDNEEYQVIGHASAIIDPVAVIGANTFDRAVTTTNWPYEIYGAIQFTIDESVAADTINVYPGTYNEDIVIDKGLSLIGAGRDDVTIQGSNTGDSGVFEIKADNVTVDGFTIIGAGKKTVRVNAATTALTFSNNKVITATNPSNDNNGWSAFETNYGQASTDHVITDNIFVGNNSDQLVYYNPDVINLTLTGNTFEGTMVNNMSFGPVLGFDGLDGNQVITGNVFNVKRSGGDARYSVYALVEAFGTYDLEAIKSDNNFQYEGVAQDVVVIRNKIRPAYRYNSTNELNKNSQTPGRVGQDAPYVELVSMSAIDKTITLNFKYAGTLNPGFEVRLDGEETTRPDDEHYNPWLPDYLYRVLYFGYGPYEEQITYTVDQYLEVRSTFGAERDFDFDWTKFEFLFELWVCETGDCGHPGYEYSSIQDAIDAADIGATIHVMAGTYNDDGGTVINKSGLNIILEDGVVIQNDSPCFSIEESYTTIEAESIGGASCVATSGSSGIEVVDDSITDVTIKGLDITGDDSSGQNGIEFLGAINNVVIADNYIHDLTGDGVHFTEQPTFDTSVSFYIQGNLFKHNDGDGVYNGGTTDVNAEYNSWSDYAGVDGPDGDGATNANTDPYTHVDLYMVSLNAGLADNWPNQVFVDDSDPITPNDTITYQVKASVVNLTGASFDLNFPTALVSAALVPGSVNSAFSPVPGKSEVVTIASGVISFDGITGATIASVTPLTDEDIVLFEVTFTGEAPGEALLDFDEDTDEFSMSPVGGGPSNNIYADELVDATLDVITRPTLDVDGLDTDFVAGLTSHEITLQTCSLATGGDWTESVASPIEPDTIGWVRISDITLAEIASLQFLWQGGWYEFSVQDAVGGTAVQQDGDDVIARFGNYDFGMEIPVNWCDVDKFRITFVNPGTHDVTIYIYDMMDTSQNVIGGDDILLAYLGPEEITILGDFDVKGTVSMQGRSVRSGVPLTLTDVDGAPTYGPHETDSTSQLAFNVLFEGVNGSIYQITTLQPRYLNITEDLEKLILVNSAFQMQPLELQGGNAKWREDDGGTWVYNNVVNLGDASLVGAQYGWTGDTSTQDADVNFDGKVNIQDLALVGGNYDLTSAVAYASWTPDGDVTVPTLDSVDPTAGTVELASGESFVLTVDASDTGNNLYELEIDHNISALPEFSVYANAANPYGTAADKAEFESYGVVVTYFVSEQKWTIDFGPAVTSTYFIGNNVTFYIKLIDFAGNAFGSMDPTTPANTFSYAISLE